MLKQEISKYIYQMLVLNQNNEIERNLLVEREKMLKTEISYYKTIIFKKYENLSNIQMQILENKWKKWVISLLPGYMSEIEVYTHK